MFRRPRPEEIEEELPQFTKGERIGSAIAHGTPLLVGVPLVLITPLVGGDPFMALVPCPIIAYVISRSFRHRQSPWGTFQAMQAALVQLILIVLAFIFIHLGRELPIQLEAASFVLTFLLFLYTLWGAWDCAFGYDFRYIFISNFVDKVTAANLRRQEMRRRRLEDPNRNDPPGAPRL